MSPLLEADGLTKRYGAIAAVDDLSFSLRRGELLAMIGPNGAGKSTCFNMLMGQTRPTSGRVRLMGEDITGMAPRAVWRRGVGRTFQVTGTYASMTVVENVQMALISHHRRVFSLRPRARDLYRDAALEYLALVGMEAQADRHAAVLAYGDLKRLELAIALSHDPVLLLMDEPTAGMAPGERVALMELTSSIVAERGVGVLFTEHDMDVVFSHAERVIVLNRGRLIAEGSVEEIRADARVREVYLGGGALRPKEVAAGSAAAGEGGDA